MKYLLTTAVFLFSGIVFANEESHPGLPPSSTSSRDSSSGASSIYSDINSRGTTINTKYGTSMTADEIKDAAQRRRAQRDLEKSSGPSSVIPSNEPSTY